MNVANFYWHDDVIIGLSVNPNYEGQREIILDIELFSDPENAKAPSRSGKEPFEYLACDCAAGC